MLLLFASVYFPLCNQTRNFMQAIMDGGSPMDVYGEKLANIGAISDNTSESLNQTGISISEGLTKGMEEADVESGSENLFDRIIGKIKELFGIHSPSTVMAEMGGFVIEGLLNGFKNMWGSITSWIEDKVNWIIDKFRSIKEKVSGFSSGGSGDSAGNYSARSYSMRSTPSPYAANPAFASLATTPIPQLATGAVIPANKEFLAVLGDQKRGTNIEAPLETIKQANRESLLELISELRLGDRMDSKGNTYNIKAIAKSEVLFELIIEEGKKRQISSGFRLSFFISDIFGASGRNIIQRLIEHGQIDRASLDSEKHGYHVETQA